MEKKYNDLISLMSLITSFLIFRKSFLIVHHDSTTLILLKFIYSEKATKFCEIFTLLLSYVVPVKSKVKILQNFVAFSEYMNFNKKNQNYNCKPYKISFLWPKKYFKAFK